MRQDLAARNAAKKARTPGGSAGTLRFKQWCGRPRQRPARRQAALPQTRHRQRRSAKRRSASASFVIPVAFRSLSPSFLSRLTLRRGRDGGEWTFQLRPTSRGGGRAKGVRTKKHRINASRLPLAGIDPTKPHREARSPLPLRGRDREGGRDKKNSSFRLAPAPPHPRRRHDVAAARPLPGGGR